MKKSILAIALLLTASAAFAGGHKCGDVVVVDNTRVIVTKVDANGNILATKKVSGARTPVAFTDLEEHPQPQTGAALTVDANRHIRWQPWLYRNAFSASVLEQIQDQLNTGKIPLGKISAYENKSVVDSVARDKMRSKPGLVIADDQIDLTQKSIVSIVLKVWTFRHNYGDTGLYQLYISADVKYKSTTWDPCRIAAEKPFTDIQELKYEFDDPSDISSDAGGFVTVCDEFTVWRGAVIRVDAFGKVLEAGTQKGTHQLQAVVDADEKAEEVVAGSLGGDAPLSEAFKNEGGIAFGPFGSWEIAPVLPRAAYTPNNALDRPIYFHPADGRTLTIERKAGEAPVNTRKATRLSWFKK